MKWHQWLSFGLLMLIPIGMMVATLLQMYPEGATFCSEFGWWCE